MLCSIYSITRTSQNWMLPSPPLTWSGLTEAPPAKRPRAVNPMAMLGHTGDPLETMAWWGISTSSGLWKWGFWSYGDGIILIYTLASGNKEPLVTLKTLDTYDKSGSRILLNLSRSIAPRLAPWHNLRQFSGLAGMGGDDGEVLLVVVAADPNMEGAAWSTWKLHRTGPEWFKDSLRHVSRARPELGQKHR